MKFTCDDSGLYTMRFFSRLDRLTWDQRGPAPYESARSVFTKVMMLNALSFRELRELIQRPDTRQAIFPDAIGSGAWIDFGRYSSLLRVDQARLKAGFLDWLGFNVPTWGMAVSRQCPECAKLNYYCSLFDLAILDECPWHKCGIGKPYGECILKGDELDRWDMISSQQTEIDWRNVPGRPVIKRLPVELGSQIESACRRLIGWWAYAKQNQSGAADLFSPVIEAGTLRHDFREQRGMALFLVQQDAPFPFPWRHSVDLIKARIVRLESCRRAIEFSPERSEAGAREFACLRRHIFKRFVKPHRRCLKMMRNMDEAERLSLDASFFCSVSAAYLAWSAAHAIQRSQDNSAAHERPRFELVREGSLTDVSTWGRRAEQSLRRFFEGWSAIEHITDTQGICICTRLESPISGYPGWEPKVQNVAVERAPDGRKESIRFIVEDEGTLADRAWRRCENREAERASMLDTSAYIRHAYGWCEIDSDDNSLLLFKIRQTDRKRAGYRYVYI